MIRQRLRTAVSVWVATNRPTPEEIGELALEAAMVLCITALAVMLMDAALIA